MEVLLIACLSAVIISGINTDEVVKSTTRKSSVLTITLKTTPASRKTTATARRTTIASKITSIDYTNNSLEDSYENITELPLNGCDANYSCSTTETPNVTTVVTHPNSISKKKIVSNTYKNNHYCTCDLQLDYCDINCCCDEDCSAEDKSVFSHCEVERLHYDTRYCDYMKYIYINNTPFEWHVNQNGMFCVLKTNLPPSYIVQKKNPILSYAIANEEKSNKFSWPKLDGFQIEEFSASADFKYKSSIWIVDRYGIRKFKLPNKMITNRCLIQEDVLYFVDTHRKCNVHQLNEDNSQLSLRNYFDEKYVIASPKLINMTKYNKNGMFQDCPRNVCLPIKPKVCDLHFQKCESVSRNDSSIDVLCTFDPKLKKHSCNNIVRKLRYNFYHNGVHGFVEIELLAQLDNYSFDGKDLEYAQQFSVNFWWVNQTLNYSSILSGNPGYLLGKPILTGTLTNTGNATQPLYKIFRSPSSYLENFLNLPENFKGKCILNHDYYVPVEFGYNMITKCKLKGSLYYAKSKINGNEICRNIQRIILNFWDISDQNKTVGMFGNADANQPGQWLGILYDTYPKTIINTTTGHYFSKNKSVVCSKLTSQLDIGILHSKVDFKDLQNQEKILAVTYSFENFIVKSFIHSKNITGFEINLSTHVGFYDVTSEKKKHFVDPPTFDVKLPYDFFYPFVKVNSARVLKNGNIVFNVFVIPFVIYVL